MSEGPTTVGSIRGKVDIDIATALAQIEEVKAAVASLRDRSLTVRVRQRDEDVSGTRERARAEDDVTRSTNRRTRATDDLERSTSRATRSTSGFNQASEKQNDIQAIALRTLIEMAVALPPVAAGAFAAAGALGGMGVAGGLAIAGIARAMKDGTGEGRAYTGMVYGLQANVHQLQDAAARGLLPGFERTVSVLEGRMPFLNSAVEEFAGRLGNIAPTGLEAVFNLIERGMPAFRSGSDLIAHLVDGLENFSVSPEYGQFIDYTVRNMPQVERLLDTVLHVAGQLLAAWGPIGEQALPVLTDMVSSFGDLVTAVKPVLPAIMAVYFGFRAWSTATAIIGGVTGALAKMNAALAVTATAEAAAGEAGAAGGAAGAAGAGGRILGGAAKAVPYIAAGYAGYTVGKMALGALGATPGKNGDAYQIAPGSPLSGIPNVGPARQTPKQAAKTSAGVVAASSYSAVPQWSPGSGVATGATYNASAGINAKAVNEAAQAARTHQAAAMADAAALRAQAAAFEASAKAAQVESAAAVSSESAHEGAESAVDDLTKSIKTNGTTLDIHTEKGRANRAAFVAGASAARAYGADVTKSTGSVAAGEVATIKYGQSMVEAAVKSGMNRKAAESLTKQLLGLPKDTSLKVDLDAAKAAKKAEDVKQSLQAFAKGDYKASLDADPATFHKKLNEAATDGKHFDSAKYKAMLMADGTPAKQASQAAQERANDFARAKYLASLKASNDTGAGVSSAQGTINSLRGKTVTLTTIHNDIYNSIRKATGDASRAAQIARNATQYGATGGTAGSRFFGGSLSQVPGMAMGGTPGFTVNGPGTASSDSAGMFRLANGEEVISNLFGQADRWRPLLKAINSNKLDGRLLDRLAGAAKSRIVVRTVQPIIHVHNPVAVDPVQQTAEAAQMALAAAGIG